MKARGVTKWYDTRLGYGFVVSEDGEDAFVHWKNIDMEGYKALKEGWKVEYEVHLNSKGLYATHVTVLNETQYE